MSKYIDADLYVEMQIFDDEHEEWGEWQGTIEDLLDQWTEQGCPTPIEVSEDCISRADLLKTIDDNVSQQYRDTYETYGLDLWALFVRIVKNAPSVVPRLDKESLEDIKEHIAESYVEGYMDGQAKL